MLTAKKGWFLTLKFAVGIYKFLTQKILSTLKCNVVLQFVVKLMNLWIPIMGGYFLMFKTTINHYLYAIYVVFSYQFYVYGTMHLSIYWSYKYQRNADFFALYLVSKLYMFQTPFVSIIRSTINCSSSHWCFSWVGME